MTLGSHQQSVGKSQTHFTPRQILDALDEFDLDPCAGDPRPWDCARVNYTEADDGLGAPRLAGGSQHTLSVSKELRMPIMQSENARAREFVRTEEWRK